MNKRNDLIDIVKGIGIVSIVVGHAVLSIFNGKLPIGHFAYTYHLMIFMFVIGFLFNKEKFNSDSNYKYKYISKQLFKLLIMYFLYNLVFVLGHNLFVKFNLINADYIDLNKMIFLIFNSLTFSTKEKLLGAFWFIPMMIFAKIIFVISYSKKLFKKDILNLLLYLVITGGIGLALCMNSAFIAYHIQISFLGTSVIYLGVIANDYEDKLSKYITKYLWIIVAIIIFIILILTGKHIDLSANKVINPFMFYLYTILGITFCFSLAKFISSIKFINKLFTTFGINSFHIMALHLLVFKIIDFIYSKINNINDINIISNLPTSYHKLWPLYIILGVIIPVIVIIPFKYINKKLKITDI